MIYGLTMDWSCQHLSVEYLLPTTSWQIKYIVQFRPPDDLKMWTLSCQNPATPLKTAVSCTCMRQIGFKPKRLYIERRLKRIVQANCVTGGCLCYYGRRIDVLSRNAAGWAARYRDIIIFTKNTAIFTNTAVICHDARWQHLSV